MIFYYTVCSFSIFLAFLCKKVRVNGIKKEHKLFFVLIAGFPMFLAAALRKGIGTDYKTYVEMFQLYFSKGYMGKIEPIFYVLNRVVSVIGLHYQWVFVFCAAIYIYCIYSFIYCESENRCLSIFLLVGMTFYLSMFNTMRQHIACAIAMLGLHYINKNKIKRFLFLNVIAIGFHYSSVVFLIVLVLRKIDFNRKVALFGTFFVLACAGPVAAILVKIISFTRYSVYITSNAEGISIAGILGILLQVVLFLFASFCYKSTPKYKLYYSLQAIATWIPIIGCSLPLINRVKWIFSIPSIILITMALNNMKNRKLRMMMTFAIVVSFTIYSYIVVVVVGSYEVLPYRCVFFD